MMGLWSCRLPSSFGVINGHDGTTAALNEDPTSFGLLQAPHNMMALSHSHALFALLCMIISATTNTLTYWCPVQTHTTHEKLALVTHQGLAISIWYLLFFPSIFVIESPLCFLLSASSARR